MKAGGRTCWDTSVEHRKQIRDMISKTAKATACTAPKVIPARKIEIQPPSVVKDDSYQNVGIIVYTTGAAL